MNHLPRSGDAGREHDRACELAAARPDGFLEADEVAWLERHLAACGACRTVAAELDAQHDLFAAARAHLPEAPRDLWARTAAAIEADGRRGRARRGRRVGSWVYAPLAGAMVVAIAVGAGLLNGFPAVDPGTPAVGPDATPIALTAGDVTVLTRSEDGRLELRRQTVEEVCPLGAESCGISSTPEVTQTERIADAGADTDTWSAIISPDSDNVVVMDRGGSTGIYVLPLRDPATSDAPPTTAPTPVPAATPAPASTGDTSGLPGSSEQPSPIDAPSGDPGSSADPVESLTPPEPTLDVAVTPAPEPSPSIKVTARPDGAIEIARDVVLVGSTAGYSPDGTRFAFSARPADGSAGPDVFVWAVGDKRAARVTDDHASLFSGWLADELLVSRVVGDDARTFVLALEDRTERPAHRGPMWRPTVAPDARTAVWWDGSVVPAADGHMWLPAAGKLVVEPWPAGEDGQQVLAADGITDWQVQWDDTGTLLAVWTTSGGPGEAGTLSLYAIDQETGRADLDAPKLDREPAYEGSSLRSGRLTWSAPADDGQTTVQVLAWDGDTFGRLEIPAESGSTVVR